MPSSLRWEHPGTLDVAEGDKQILARMATVADAANDYLRYARASGDNNVVAGLKHLFAMKTNQEVAAEKKVKFMQAKESSKTSSTVIARIWQNALDPQAEGWWRRLCPIIQTFSIMRFQEIPKAADANDDTITAISLLWS